MLTPPAEQSQTLSQKSTIDTEITAKKPLQTTKLSQKKLHLKYCEKIYSSKIPQNTSDKYITTEQKSPQYSTSFFIIHLRGHTETL